MVDLIVTCGSIMLIFLKPSNNSFIVLAADGAYVPFSTQVLKILPLVEKLPCYNLMPIKLFFHIEKLLPQLVTYHILLNHRFLYEYSSLEVLN